MVGPNIYTIGGLVNDNASSSVTVMDCRSHTWREAPPMRVAREFQSACVLDGKIYIPSEEIFGGSEYKSIEYEGTVYVRSEAKDVTYKLNKDRWRTADLAMNSGWDCRSSSYRVIENVFYRSDGKTVDCLTRFAYVNLVNYGGKMAVLWEEYVVAKNHKETMIWCAEFAIEKRQKREIWGMLEWVDIVLLSTTNEPYGLAHVLATTI
ncbi:PREDICTED: F-box/kelch-repeat protein At4g23580-like [Camelina sativa]|uniref:F-box/kelch-repeat protein At4g23580-like n=1 Tax=Camelina sativa TaxID=90675 RepID=A0ABM0XR98_CAMSA|nr:PREDICTED: F-box/kelch-repeat protein At4g23580-like [Camelina sativa]